MADLSAAAAPAANPALLPRPTFRWSPEMDDYLKAEWGKASASIIGEKLGVTRNAVIGRANRLQLRSNGYVRTGYQRRPMGTQSHKAYAAKPKSPVVVAPPILESKEIPLLRLKTRHCRFVTGKGKNGLATFCGHNRELMMTPLGEWLLTPYCPGHHYLCQRFH